MGFPLRCCPTFRQNNRSNTGSEKQKMHHNLKLFKTYFQPVVDGDKRSECRINDRDYRVGDTVTLREGQPGISGFEYTGRSVSASISYVSDFGCQPGYVNLSLKNVGILVVGEQI